MMSAKYFEYYTIILRGAIFSWTHCIISKRYFQGLQLTIQRPLNTFKNLICFQVLSRALNF